MDRITQSLITELNTNLDLVSEGESKDFEKLSNYTVISNEYNKTFQVDSVTIGEGNDTGIDGIAIIVNGQLIEDVEEVSDFLEKNNFLEVTYIFIQSKPHPVLTELISTLFFSVFLTFSLRHLGL